uniref:hypothetical protein n=1 Tax=Pedobacter schmidteae TaxID=2201271 RepID=UPI000EB1EBF7|nr:hypothetical protein [Pedobacter schmidteae]
MDKKLFYVFFLSGISLTVSCGTVKDPGIRNALFSSNCNQRNLYNYTVEQLPTPLYKQQLSKRLTRYFDHNTLNIANAIGILNLIDKYIELRSDKDSTSLISRLSVLEVRQKIDHKINTASIEISAISSEMDCEEERISQVANYLSSRQDERESKLTKGAIVVGALGAILTGGLIKNDAASNSVGITTGVAEAGLGVAMLFNKESVEFHHERNALKDVWFNTSTSNIFPPLIWYYLNYKNPEIGQNKSLRDQMVEKWINLGQIDLDPKKSSLELFFGRGGEYATDQLENRADMYDQLESNITLMKQDLKALSLEIDKI